MRRLAKVAVGIVATAVALPVVVVVVALIAGFRALPDDTTPPRAPSVPAEVTRALWVECGGAPDAVRSIGLRAFVSDFFDRSDRDRRATERVPMMAARILTERAPVRRGQLERQLVEGFAEAYVAARWSADEALAEIATHWYYGHGFTGIESAAAGYFGRPAAELDTLQVATLVAMTRAPSRLSPWCHPEELLPWTRKLAGKLGEAPSDTLPELRPPPPGACEDR